MTLFYILNANQKYESKTKSFGFRGEYGAGKGAGTHTSIHPHTHKRHAEALFF